MSKFGKPSTNLVLEVGHRVSAELEKVHFRALEPWTGYHRMGELVSLLFSRDPVRIFNAIGNLPVEFNEVLRLKARLLKIEKSHSNSWFFLDDDSDKTKGAEEMHSMYIDGTNLHNLIGAMLEVGLISDKVGSENRGKSLNEPWNGIYFDRIGRIDTRCIADPELPEDVQRHMLFLLGHSPEEQGKLMKEKGLRAGSLEEILDFCLDQACRAILKANDVRAAVLGALLPENWRDSGTANILLPNLYYDVGQSDATVLSYHQRLSLVVNRRSADFLTVCTVKQEDWEGTIFAVKGQPIVS